jgi:hypothetical protein
MIDLLLYFMLSQRQPINELFETAFTQPMNYVQAMQRLIEPSVPPEIDPTRVMNLRMSRINTTSIDRYKSAFYNLAEKVRSKENNVQVFFEGLDYYRQKYTKEKCCTWFSQHKSHPERELILLLSAIESQSREETNQYVIKLV